jgi:hypothetical protein
MKGAPKGREKLDRLGSYTGPSNDAWARFVRSIPTGHGDRAAIQQSKGHFFVHRRYRGYVGDPSFDHLVSDSLHPYGSGDRPSLTAPVSTLASRGSIRVTKLVAGRTARH